MKLKKCAALFLSLLFLLPAAGTVMAEENEAYPLLLEEITIRDPFVLVHDGRYYMYGTGLKWNGYGCVVSEDLEHWSEPRSVFAAPEGFDGTGDWWAPECHEYKGSFYLFATYLSASSGKRGTAIFRADDPLGPFEPLSDGHITPKERDCIDGTLYVDENGTPWIVYAGEWTSSEDGVGIMCAAKLSDDLSRTVGEPKTLFRADDPKWTGANITDGPFIYRSYTGKLFMLWSNMNPAGYAVGLAASSDGTVSGRWKQSLKPFYEKDRRHAGDGGHPMLFRDLDGRLLMAIHSPNFPSEGGHETAVFLPVTDLGFTLRVTDGGFFSSFLVRLADIIQRLYGFFASSGK